MLRQAASPARSIIFQRCNPAERFGQASPFECDVNDRCAYSISGQIPATLIYGSSVDRPALPLYKTIPRRLVDRERQRGKLVETTIIKLGLSARAYSRVLKVGRTIPISPASMKSSPLISPIRFNIGVWTGDCKFVRKDLIEGIIGKPVTFFSQRFGAIFRSFLQLIFFDLFSTGSTYSAKTILR